ncbi:MAG: glycosyltransferase family 2 protein [Dysgonamonadaceae bacterium]|jgi:GT2 family glycosyltransferase|nr:glycosyltransferase family 2 protein [Dysgonamonadaceae bacterium]
MNKKTAVVILNWNGRKLLEKFLPALIKNTPEEEADIIVADNGSTDDSLQYLKQAYPSVRIIPMGENYGFAEGYNRALAQLNYQYAVLLNSDVEVAENWLTTAIRYLENHPHVAALQPKILSYNDKSVFEYAGACGGFLDIYGYPFCRGRIFDTLEKDAGQYDRETEILWASGACLFIRVDDYREAGGLDAGFFAHQEEIDLCWRLRARGKTIVCLPQSTVYHLGGATLNMEHPRKTFLNFRNNLLLIYKNLPEKYYRRVMLFRAPADCAAALQLLLKGHPANAWAVVKAHWDFAGRKKRYKAVRRENLEKSKSGLPHGIFKISLLWEYYIRKRRRYEMLEELRTKKMIND